MSTIVMGLNSGLRSAEERAGKKRMLIDYLLAHFKQHNMYALRYWFCEALCLVNIIGQLYLMNRFTGGEFFTYGLKGIFFFSNFVVWRLIYKFVQCCLLPTRTRSSATIP